MPTFKEYNDYGRRYNRLDLRETLTLRGKPVYHGGNFQDQVEADYQLFSRLDLVERKLNYTPMDILTLTNTVNSVEIGSTVTSITFNWSRNKVPQTLSFNQGIGSITPALLMYTASVNLSANTTYTLTATDGTDFPGNTDTASTTVSFSHRAYYGTSAAETLDSAGVLALANKPFASSRARSFSLDGGGKYFYYVYPASWGNASFTVNGLQSTAWVKSTLNFTNASGNTTSFNVYRSSTVQNGTGISISAS